MEKIASTGRKQRPLFTVADLGPDPDPRRLPARLDRLNAATLLTALGVPLSRRSMERLEGVAWAKVGGVAVAKTADLIAYARRRLGEAVPIASGTVPAADASKRRARRAAQPPA